MSNDAIDHDGYYYNVETHEVEHGKQSDWNHRMGPFATAAEAQAAIEKAKSRNEQWDKEDEEWDSWGESK
ncbi:hypothetical protein JT358_09800 [Micrococcales bacterium 31B]|nr:hypothetical protein [Micrococcales bacterium 31B]